MMTDFRFRQRRPIRSKQSFCWRRIGCLLLLLTGQHGGAVSSSEWSSNHQHEYGYNHQFFSGGATYQPQHMQQEMQQHPNQSQGQGPAAASFDHVRPNSQAPAVPDPHPLLQQQRLEPEPEPETVTPPDMKPKHVAFALQRTAFINDRLLQNSHNRVNLEELVSDRFPPHEHSIPPPPVSTRIKVPPRTIFDAPEKLQQQSSSKHLRSSLAALIPKLLTQVPSKQERSTVLSLALIYLDRATSVETIRTRQVVPACPFCTSTTVHRLMVAAILTAVRVVQGQTLSGDDNDSFLPTGVDWDSIREELPGSSDEDLQNVRDMMLWMEAALGDLRYYVTLDDMKTFKRGWERFFPPSPSDIYVQQVSKQEPSS